jgi:hypothetical protein
MSKNRLAKIDSALKFLDDQGIQRSAAQIVLHNSWREAIKDEFEGNKDFHFKEMKQNYLEQLLAYAREFGTVKPSVIRSCYWRLDLPIDEAAICYSFGANPGVDIDSLD